MHALQLDWLAVSFRNHAPHSRGAYAQSLHGFPKGHEIVGRMIAIKSKKLVLLTYRANSRFIAGVALSCPQTEPVEPGRNLLVAESISHLPNEAKRDHSGNFLR